MADSVRSNRIGDSDVPVPRANPLEGPGVSAVEPNPTVIARLGTLGDGKGDTLSDIDNLLTIIKGSTTPFKIDLKDANDQDLNVADVDEAKLTVRTHVGATDEVLGFTLDDEEMTLTGSRLTVHLSQEAADALEGDDYIAQVALHYASADEWRMTKYFRVRVTPNMFVEAE